MNELFRGFNCLQIVGLFAAGPTLISWLSTLDGHLAYAGWVVAWMVYVVMFWFMTASVFKATESS